MDPPHITEFASERYFSKLNQLNDPARAASITQHSHQSPSKTQVQQAPPDVASQSTFILPLRAPKATDGSQLNKSRPDKEKSRLRGLRSKVSFLHSRSSHACEELDSPRTLLSDPSKPSGYVATVPEPSGRRLELALEASA